MSNRIYRPVEPSDLPAIQSGKLQALYKDRVVRLVSTHYRNYGWQGESAVLWLFEKDGYEWPRLGYDSLVIDITPEKRYTIWNKSGQRFVDGSQYPPSASKVEQELHIEKWKRNGARVGSYVIVEFDYPGE